MALFGFGGGAGNWTASVITSMLARPPDFDRFASGVRESSGAVATYTLYQDDPPPPEMVDRGGYYKLNGTGSGSELQSRGVGIAVGDTALDIATKLGLTPFADFLRVTYPPAQADASLEAAAKPLLPPAVPLYAGATASEFHGLCCLRGHVLKRTPQGRDAAIWRPGDVLLRVEPSLRPKERHSFVALAGAAPGAATRVPRPMPQGRTPTGRIGMGEYVMVNGRRGRITVDDGTMNPYKVTFDDGSMSGWLTPGEVTRLGA